MGKNSGGSGTESTVRIWDHLEEMVREKVQAFIQAILEEEVTELLGRQKWSYPVSVDR